MAISASKGPADCTAGFAGVKESEDRSVVEPPRRSPALREGPAPEEEDWIWEQANILFVALVTKMDMGCWVVWLSDALGRLSGFGVRSSFLPLNANRELPRPRHRLNDDVGLFDAAC